MKRGSAIQKTALLLVGAVIFLSYLNKALFTHTHLLPDGTVIVHAHPYLKHNKEKQKKIPVSSHNHTPEQYVFLGLHYIYFPGEDPLTVFSPNNSKKAHFAPEKVIIITCPLPVLRVRPPPAFI